MAGCPLTALLAVMVPLLVATVPLLAPFPIIPLSLARVDRQSLVARLPNLVKFLLLALVSSSLVPPQTSSPLLVCLRLWVFWPSCK